MKNSWTDFQLLVIIKYSRYEYSCTYLLNILHDPWGGYLKHFHTRGHSKALLKLVDLLSEQAPLTWNTMFTLNND